MAGVLAMAQDNLRGQFRHVGQAASRTLADLRGVVRRLRAIDRRDGAGVGRRHRGGPEVFGPGPQPRVARAKALAVGGTDSGVLAHDPDTSLAAVLHHLDV